MKWWSIASSLAAALCCVSLPSYAVAHPTVTVGADVAADRRIAMERIDHSRWNELLQKYVDPNGLVDYTSWKATTADIQVLDAYMEQLSSAVINPKSSRESQLAFWINAYNAATVKGILRECPTSSIRNHTAKVYGYNIWKDLQLIVGGHGILIAEEGLQTLVRLIRFGGMKSGGNLLSGQVCSRRVNAAPLITSVRHADCKSADVTYALNYYPEATQSRKSECSSAQVQYSADCGFWQFDLNISSLHGAADTRILFSSDSKHRLTLRKLPIYLTMEGPIT